MAAVHQGHAALRQLHDALAHVENFIILVLEGRRGKRCMMRLCRACHHSLMVCLGLFQVDARYHHLTLALLLRGSMTLFSTKVAGRDLYTSVHPYPALMTCILQLQKGRHSECTTDASVQVSCKQVQTRTRVGTQTAKHSIGHSRGFQTPSASCILQSVSQVGGCAPMIPWWVRA